MSRRAKLIIQFGRLNFQEKKGGGEESNIIFTCHKKREKIRRKLCERLSKEAREERTSEKAHGCCGR